MTGDIAPRPASGPVGSIGPSGPHLSAASGPIDRTERLERIERPLPVEEPPVVRSGASYAPGTATLATSAPRSPDGAGGPVVVDGASINGNGNGLAHPLAGNGAAPGTTAAQLRRFIKSRSWVPMHELRRRFGINGVEDDVTPVAVEGGTIFVGLPAREGQLLGELLRAGDIGYELSVDPDSPIVIGVYPMRPVPRH